MPLLNVGKVVSNPMFAENFTIERSVGGKFDNFGKWINNTATVLMWGVVQPATAKELQMVPSSDRVNEVKSFHSEQEMRVTHTDGTTDANQGISDICIWNDKRYRLVKLYQWQDFGYFKALGVRIEGA